MPIAYKIFLKEGSKLKSYIYNTLPKSFAMIYKEGVWNEPKRKYSKLFVFKSLKDAKIAHDSNAYREIWQVAVDELEKAPWRSFVTCAYVGPLSERFKIFWAEKKQYRFKAPMSTFTPKGTYFCGKVKLLKKVS